MNFFRKASLAQLCDSSAHVSLTGDLLPPDAYQRPRQVRVDGLACRYADAIKALAGSHVTTPPVRAYRVRDPVLVDQGIVLTPDGYAIAESLADTKTLDNDWVRVDGDGVWLKKEPATERSISGLLLKKRGQTNYGHWLAELLVKLFVHSSVTGSDTPVIVHKPAPQFAYLRRMYRESIDLCCPSAPEVIEMGGEPVRCAEVIWVSGLSSHPLRKHPAMADMASAMKRGVGPSPVSSKVFIARTDRSFGRMIANEDAVLRFFRDEGFEILDPAHYGQREQIQIFSGASHVFGTMCAAFTNTLFSPASCLVGYLAPVYMPGTYYIDLDSVMRRRQFNLFYCDYTDHSKTPTLTSDITVPVGEMMRWYHALG